MKVLGITEEVNICDCCGKKDLERTVALELNGGEVAYYGTTCATRKHGVKTGIKSLNKIELMRKTSANIQEFIKLAKRYGFGDTKVLTPIYDNVACVTWVWGAVEVKSTSWVQA